MRHACIIGMNDQVTRRILRECTPRAEKDKCGKPNRKHFRIGHDLFTEIRNDYNVIDAIAHLEFAILNQRRQRHASIE